MKYTYIPERNIFEQTLHLEPKGTLQKWLIGRPLATADMPHQTIGKLIGLAVFSSDALSSVAYGPQELMMILALAGIGALNFTMPMIIGIVSLLAILTFSYEQTIHAYPGGGGAYIVARDNLGELPAQTAGAALLTDYVLTVSVSIASGVAQIVSAFPSLYDYRVYIAVGMILLIMLINLRGVKESGVVFAIPTYFFLVMIYLTVLIGFVRVFAGTLGTVTAPPAIYGAGEMLQPVSLLLILRAFASGTSSVTGVEAISNGITAFKEPRSHNAGRTLIWMAGILGSLLLATSFLSLHIHAVPSDGETLISQVVRTVYNGRDLLYLLTISSITIILMMAANTAFADFPRLGALHAGDGFLPRQLTFRGSRLVFSRGIVALTLLSSLLIVLFQASVTNLIPLYAIGVFLSFTLSQAGMARRWYRCGKLKSGEEIVDPGSTLRYEKNWKAKMAINALGSVSTLVVMITFAVAKFTEGAWVVVLLTPLLVAGFFAIHHHYRGVAQQLSLDRYKPVVRPIRNRVIMPISGVHRGTLLALRYARSLSDDVTAVHVSIDPNETKRLEAKWESWGDGIRLVVLNSPYRMFVEPLLNYIGDIDRHTLTGETITIVVPQFVPKHFWTGFLHARTAETLRKALLNRDNIVITEVPYQVK